MFMKSYGVKVVMVKMYPKQSPHTKTNAQISSSKLVYPPTAQISPLI